MKNKSKTKAQSRRKPAKTRAVRPSKTPKFQNSKTPQATKRTPLERMKKIYGWLQDATYPNCARITDEYHISRLTALRDIDFMRDQMELPIEYDDKRHGYYFSEPVAGLPVRPVTHRELFWVCVAHKAIEQYRGTPFQQPLELAFQKLSGQLDDRERFTLHNLDEA